MIDPATLGKEFMGRGWAFPFRILTETGRVDTVEHEDDIDQSIKIILGTAKGERKMRPDFGCGIHNQTFAAIDLAAIIGIKRDVETALRTFEPRIEVLAVTVDTAPLFDGCLDVRIAFRYRNTNQSGNFVYPFYFKEAR